MDLGAGVVSVRLSIVGIRLRARLEPLVHDLSVTSAGETDESSARIEVRDVDGPEAWQIITKGVCRPPVKSDDLEFSVLWEITRVMLEAAIPTPMVHAAAVSYGRYALLLVGPAGCGKSSLCAFLTSRGWSYLTDEGAVMRLPGDGGAPIVEAFPRPIRLRPDNPLAVRLAPGLAPSERGPSVMVVASDLGTIGAAAPLAAIVFPRFDAAPGAQLQPKTPAEALTGMAAVMPVIGRGSRAVFAGLAEVARSVAAVDLLYDDLESADAVLTDLVQERASERADR